jgi:flavin-dependent dehydrogenase
MPPQTELFLLPGGYVGVNPIENGRANLCALLSYDAFAAAGKQIDVAVEQMQRWNPALAERLAGAIPQPDSVCTVAAVDTMRRPRPWDGVACVGDTAAMIPPLCGDGMAMALQAAALCAPLAAAFLRGDCSREQWRARYVAAWHIKFDRRLRVGWMLQQTLGWPIVSDLLLEVGRYVPALTTRLVQATRGSVSLGRHTNEVSSG